MTAPTWTDAHGAITAYPDIPSEYLVGLDRGKLGDWLQELYEAGWSVHVENGEAFVTDGDCMEWGEDRDTHRVDVMILRAYLAWKGREG